MSDFRELGRTIGQSVTQGRDIASLMFVWTAEKSEDNFDITTLAEHAYLFDRWVERIPYNASQIRIDESDGQLYRCLTTHGAEHATAPPSQASALWEIIDNYAY
jgi:hypothetical protein